MVYNAMRERIKSLEIARKQKKTPDKETSDTKPPEEPLKNRDFLFNNAEK